MKIHEYQGKELLRKFNIPVPMGRPVLSFNEVEAAAKALIAETENEFVVVKAQIHAGGRGKGGGVKVVKGAAAARETTFTPPPLPRPPAWICALTTTTSLPVSEISVLAACSASSMLNAGRPLGTGTPSFFRISLA